MAPLTKLPLRHLAQLSMLLSIALILRYIERAFPLPLPGVHLGLANAVTLFVLWRYGTQKNALLFLASRLILSGALATGFFSSGFLIGLSGATLSFASLLIGKSLHTFSLVGLGLLSAASHNVGQILAALCLMHTVAVIHYLPFLLLLGIPTGIATGYLTYYLDKRLPQN